MSVLAVDLDSEVSLIEPATVFDLTGRVLVYAGGGDDIVDGELVIGTTIKARGDGGNDTLIAGSGADNLYGDDGNDILLPGDGADYLEDSGGVNVAAAGAGDDVIWLLGTPISTLAIGGIGNDYIVEFGGENLIVAGDLDLSEEEGDLVLAEWLSGHDFDERFENLNGFGAGTGLNGTTYLIAGQSVIDDGSDDEIVRIIPGTGWYFLGLRTDTLTSTFAPNSDNVFTNTSPVDVVANTTAVRGEPIVFVLDAGELVRQTGSGPVPIEDYYIEIDWNGDDAIDETVIGGSGVEVTHAYPANGSYTATFYVVGADTPAGPESTHSVTVTTFEERAEGGQNILLVGGTTGAETISVDWDDPDTEVYIDLGVGGSYSTSTTLDAIRVYGQAGDDTLWVGLAAPDVAIELHGGNDDDGIAINNGGNGPYALFGDDGNDILFLLDATDADVTLFGGDGDDELYLNNGDDVHITMLGGDGADLLAAVGGTEITADLQGEAGEDVLLADAQFDSLAINGGDDDDLIAHFTSANVTIVAGAGNDLVFAGSGNDSIDGGTGNDLLIGHDGADSITGGSGEDLILAGLLSEDYFEDEEDPGIVQIWDQWRTADPIATRKNYLTGTSGGIIDTEYALVVGTTIEDDDLVDSVLGSGDADWLLYDFTEDTAIDYSSATDLRTDLEP